MRGQPRVSSELWKHSITVIDQELHPIMGQGQPISDALTEDG